MMPSILNEVSIGGSHICYLPDDLLILLDSLNGKHSRIELGEYHLPGKELLVILGGQFNRDIDQKHKEGG